MDTKGGVEKNSLTRKRLRARREYLEANIKRQIHLWSGQKKKKSAGTGIRKSSRAREVSRGVLVLSIFKAQLQFLGSTMEEAQNPHSG